MLSGNFADATITKVNGGYKIVLDGATTIVRNVEFVKFADGTVAANKLVNEAPTTDATQSVNGSEDVIVNGTVTAADANGDTLSYAVATSGPGAPAHGAVTIDANGNFTYTPAGNYNGTDTFTVTVTDGNGGTATQVVTVNLAAVNDAPVITGVDSSAVLVDGSATSTATPLFANFTVSDVDTTLGSGTVVAVTSDAGPWTDSFSFDGDGTASTGVEQVANLVLVNGVGYGSVTTNAYGISITFNSAATPAIIQQVIRALELDASGSGARDISITVTDAGGATSDAVTSTVTVLATDGDATMTVTDAQEIVALSNNATTVASGASVNYVETVGIGNVDNVTLTISVGGDFDTTDSLTLSTSVPTLNGEVAVIAGNLIYRTGGQNYNIGTVTGGTNGQPLVITLTDDYDTYHNLDAEDFDEALAAVIQQVKFDAADAGTDGVRTIEFLINGVGSDEASGSATVVVTDGGQINLTADSDTVTAGTQGDTNATFTAAGTPVDPDGINVFNAAAGTLTAEDNFAGGTGATDILNVVLDAAVGSPTIGKVETFNITSDNTSSLDLANVTNNDGHTMQINVDGDSDLTLTSVGSTFGEIDASELDGNIEITTVAGKSPSVVAAQGITTVHANDSATQATITIDGTSAGTKIVLDGTADFSLTGDISVNVDASDATDSVTIANVDGSITVTAGTSDLTISDSDITSAITVAAAAMGDTATLSVAGEGTLATSSALKANLDLTGFTGDYASVELGDAGDGAIAITLGAFANTADSATDFEVTDSTSGDTVTIDATAATTKNVVPTGSGGTAGVDANENVDIALAGDATFVVNGLTADVNAGSATGSVTLNVSAAADIDVVAGQGNTNINGAAEMVSIAASSLGAGDTITIGTLADDFDGDINVSVFGAGTLDAIYLDGDLTVSGDDDDSGTIRLGASVDSAIITVDDGAAPSGAVSIDAAAYANTLTLSGEGNVAVTGFHSTIDANADLDSLSLGAEEMTGGLDVTLAANANATIITGDNSSITVTSGDADGIDAGSALDGTRSTITINAAAMAADTNIVINDSTGVPNFNANVVITGVLGDAAEAATDIDLSGSVESASTATVSITTGNLGTDALDIELGSSQTVSITGTSGTINIDATAAAAADFDGNGATANTNVQLTLAGSSTYVVTNSTADILASAATGNISVTALAGSQSITTGSGIDVINAGADADTIVTGAGDDTITGGAGVDTMTGGSDNDTFIFANGASGYGNGARDIIKDFVINEDVLDLSAYNLDTAGSATTTDMNRLQISIGANSAVISIDEDGDGLFESSEEQIQLDGDYVGQSFSASDFLF